MKLSATKFFTIREEQKLFATIAKSSDKAALIDKMLFQLLSLSGLRISEALNLKWADFCEDYLVIATQKNGTIKGTVHIGLKLIKALNDFRALKLYEHSEYIFNNAPKSGEVIKTTLGTGAARGLL